MTAHRPLDRPAKSSLDQGDSGHPAPPVRSRVRTATSATLRTLLRLGPFVVAVAVAKALLDYLPQSMSGDAARYSLACCAAFAGGTTVALITVVARQRRMAADGTVTESVRPRQSIGDLLEAGRVALHGSRAEVDDPEKGRLVGWPHFVEEAKAGVRPTAIGTAYGLKACIAADPTCIRSKSVGALVDTLWRLRLADNGWAARTQSGVARPEVTALVVGVLSALGSRPERLAESVLAFEQSLTAAADPVGMSRTHVVAASLGGLVRAAPSSSRLAELRRMLVAGATRDPRNDSLSCWADRLSDGQRTGLVPSVPHTARAIVALSRAARAEGAVDGGGSDVQAESTLREGIHWLVRRAELSHQTEQIRRVVSENHSESLTVRHFTAALVANAMLCPEAAVVEGRDELLAEAIRQVWSTQHDGVWEWDNGEHPVWMIYQGLAVLHRYALATGTYPA